MRAWLDGASLVSIGLPHDGETIIEPDEQTAADRLVALRKVGYHVPQYAIDSLLIEARGIEGNGESNA